MRSCVATGSSLLTYDIRVNKGVVSLSGKVEDKKHAGLDEAFVDRVPGVVGIASKLQWEDGR